MSKAKILIVNENDEVVGLKERGTLNAEDIYRVSALWIQNSKGDTLLAQRSFDKKNDPGKWGPAVAGTVDEGETYDSNIIKEADEEIGLTNHHFVKAFYKRNDGKHKYFVQWYFALLDRDINEFTIQKEEVERIKWFSREELLKILADSPDNFLKSTKDCVTYFTNHAGSGRHIT
ncbi:MAG: NUDIX domain-containing protein [Patescibacteria group bacterium]|jgi:isopentenyldiphosphate isomerase